MGLDCYVRAACDDICRESTAVFSLPLPIVGAESWNADLR